MTRITNLLTPVTFLLALTSAAIASDSNNSSPDIATFTNASLNTAGVCYIRDFDDERRTSYAHCQRAVRLIRDNYVPASFHTNGEDDAFRLPKVVRYKSCMVVIHLVSVDELSDQCTWHAIRGAAGQLSSRCRSLTDLTTGGFNFVGDRGTIMISVEKSREYPLSVGYDATGLRSLGIEVAEKVDPGGETERR